MRTAGLNPVHPEITVEARRLVDLARAAGVTLRLLGGTAIALRAGPHIPHALSRSIGDIDCIVRRGSGPAMQRLLKSEAYEPDLKFNALYGHDRLRFLDHSNDRHVDVFVGTFRMSHELDFDERMELDPVTLSPDDLLLTKLQVVRPAAKDMSDTFLLLATHPIGATGSIDGTHVAETCARDWGLWRTATANLARFLGHLDNFGLDEATTNDVRVKTERLLELLQSQPKTRRWRLRAHLGERKRWYRVPDELVV